MLESGEIEARLSMAPRDAVVRFLPNENGDFTEMNAEDRPATDESGHESLGAWRGLFYEFDIVGGRRIPTRGEVGYIIDGKYAPHWRGKIVNYRVE